MTHTISQLHNEARLTGTMTIYDTGTVNAKIQVFTAPRPDPGLAPGAAVKLVEIVLDKPCGAIVNNTLVLESSAVPPLALASGDPFWARVVNGNGAWMDDLDAGGPLSGAEVLLSVDTIFAGGRVALISAVLT